MENQKNKESQDKLETGEVITCSTPENICISDDVRKSDEKVNSDESHAIEEPCSTPENICVEDTHKEQKNHKFDAKNYFQSQKYALSGLKLILRNERNFRLQTIAAMFVIAVAFLLQISYTDWVALSLVIALVFISEAFNSVIEAICDTITQDYRINVHYAKDVSAGAVLVSALVSAFAGVLILGPYVWRIIQTLFTI